jgi:hypothetical protein
MAGGAKLDATAKLQAANFFLSGFLAFCHRRNGGQDGGARAEARILTSADIIPALLPSCSNIPEALDLS